ncbi:uncharacterized protein LOC110456050 [Mizuhopecten yessoensis]|uniref:uncharacterized protein LOC110456050 n=1 Tax=Mizuhopecten yessoensis TaxID=6573 RepID=UPI000B45DD10|nr:uncharacterized protein LOC110456050 [Mizuhopecten yessoensis]
MKTVFFICILSLRHLIGFSQACLICCGCGSFLPDDPFYFTNETSNLICALDKPSNLVNASKLNILLNDSEVDPSSLNIVNETAVSFRKVMKKEDDGKYKCRINGLTGSSGIVGTTYLKVDGM